MPNIRFSKRKRIIYLILCVIAFFVIAPLMAYYATGYRFGDKFQIAKTGGIYVVVEGKGFTIFINGKLQDASSIFRRNFFVQDLKPDFYDVKVSKKGFNPWGKRIVVLSEKVIDIYPFNLPEKVQLLEIPKTVPEDVDESTSTVPKKEVDNEEFTFVKDLFATTSERLIVQKINASSTVLEPKKIILFKKIALWYIDDEIFVRWHGSEDSAPMYFCNIESCLNKLSVFKGVTVNNADFLSDKQAFVIFSTDNGIYVTEIDSRGGRNIQPLVLGSGYDFRVAKDQTLYIKKDKTFYRTDISL